MKKLLVALLTLLPIPALAGQIDAVLKFADEPTALTALANFVGKNEQNQATWDMTSTIRDVKVWRASQDVSGTDGQGNATVTHTYLPGFFVLISLDNPPAALKNLAAVQVVLDRDKCGARQTGCVVKSNVTNTVLQDIRMSPIFAGSDIPFGGMQ